MRRLSSLLAVAFLLTAPAVAAPDALGVALGHLEAQASRLSLEAQDLAGLVVTDRYETRHNGVTHLYLRQSLAGVPVVNANIGVHVTREGRVLRSAGDLVSGLARAANSAVPSLDPEAAVQAAADHLDLLAHGPLQRITSGSGAAPEHRFAADAGLSLESIPVRLRYWWTAPGQRSDVRLAWEVELALPDHQSFWVVWVDAADGRILAKDNLVDSDSYEVFAIPSMSPDEADRTVEMDPADTVASPFGWHDTDGSDGGEFTDTRGNNVFAQEDRDANNSGGFRPDGGANLDFLFPLDLGLSPIDYQEAAITNLFYWNNITHDVLYGYGFDEAAGNFQENNYGRGGVGGDPVQADAQDGSGLNNANFLTLTDGNDPRMQMYEWVYPFPNLVDIAEGAAAGTYIASGANFGPAFSETGVIGTLVLAQDGAGDDVNDGCEPLTNGAEINGNIAVIRRGTCAFVAKVRAAQTVGATAVVVMNNVGGGPITMGDDGTGGDILIPSAMISQDDGGIIEPELPVLGRARDAGGDTPPNRDSDLDNGIIVHEYAHGVSNRLTGGPLNVSCLNNTEQMGEGWSDWFALALTAKETDTPEQPRGMGTYVVFQATDGTGIRSHPYSTDLAVNPETYDTIKTAAIPHGVGAVWSQMLWEMHWNLVTVYGFDPDIYGGSGGNNRALQLVIDGMKLQPCSPHFVDGRDAILDADMAISGGADQCLIWKAFAKRGLGLSADAGSSFSVTDGTEAFDLPRACEGPILTQPSPGLAGAENCFDVTGAAPNAQIALAAGRLEGQVTPPGCSLPVQIGDPRVLAQGTTDANGEAQLCVSIPGGALGRTLRAQVVDRTTPGCTVSNVVVTTYE